MTGFPGGTETRLLAALEARRAGHVYREREMVGKTDGPYIWVGNKRYLNLASNDYLGLSVHPEVTQALQEAAAEYGVGAGASHLVTGHRTPHAMLERELAAFCGQPRALLFSTGYMANLGLLTTLCPRSGTVYEDRLNHASLIDAATLARAALIRYRHRDWQDLRERMAKHRGRARVIASDGVFSMDGDIVPLPELVEIARDHDAPLVVDDAHGFGVLGETGGGTSEYFGLPAADRPIMMGTLGKAFGVFGAFVAGSETVVESLIQNARSYVYTTALPPAVAAAALAALRLAVAEPARRLRLQGLISRLRSGARRLGLEFADSPTPIQPFIVGEAATALALAARLRGQGYWITAIRPPTVPAGTARLRISLSALMLEEHIDEFLEALAEAAGAFRP